MKIVSAKANSTLKQVIKKAVIDKAGTGTYVLSGYYKRSLTNSNGQDGTKFFPWVSQGEKPNVKYFVQYPTDITDTYGSDADNTDWHYFSQEFDIDESSDVDLQLYFAGSNYEPSTIHIDDLRLVKKNNIITNGDFEKGISDWDITNGGVKDILTDGAYAGMKSIKVVRSDSSEVYQSVQRYVTDALKANGDGVYHISAWAKSANAAIPRINYIGQYNDAETNPKIEDTFYAAGTPKTTDWQYIEGYVTIKNTSDLKTFRLTAFATANANDGVVSDYYVDNFSMTKVADITE